MNKKIIFLMIGIFLVGTISAGITLSQAIIPAKEKTPPIIYQGVINFNCGKTPMNVSIKDISKNYETTFILYAQKICDEEITNVVDWNGEKLMNELNDDGVNYCFESNCIDTTKKFPPREFDERNNTYNSETSEILDKYGDLINE